MGVKTLRYKWTLRGINRINAFAASGKIMQRVIAVLAALTTAGLSACVQTPAAPASCPARENAAAEVAQTMRDMYAAVKTDDYAGFHAAVTSDFFAFDVGTRFDGDALMDLIKAQHEKGFVYEWQINDPKVEVTCDMALVTYINTGSVTSNGAKRELSWLESATLKHDGQRWRIRFFHSTRVP